MGSGDFNSSPQDTELLTELGIMLFHLRAISTLEMSGEIRFIRRARQPSAWLARSIEGIGIKVESMRCSGDRRGIVGRPMTDFFLVSSVVSDSLRPHEPQHARPPCPSPTPGVYSNSCPSSR